MSRLRSISPGPIILIAAAIALLWVTGRRAAGSIPAFIEWVRATGAWGPVLYVVGYAVATVLAVPGWPLTVAAGALFGLTRGVIAVFVGATLGATAAFLIARHLARGPVARRLEGNERFAAIDRAVGREGLKMVLLLRLSPIVPFNLLNYALGLTAVSLRDYVIGSIGMVPVIALYVYYGKIAGDVALAVGGGGIRRDALYWTVLVGGLVATVVVTAIVTRMATRAVREAGANRPDEDRT